MSPGLQGRFLTPGPPGEVPQAILFSMLAMLQIIATCPIVRLVVKLPPWDLILIVIRESIQWQCFPPLSKVHFLFEEDGALLPSVFLSVVWKGMFSWNFWGRPTPVFLPGEFRDGGAWWAAVYGVAQSRTRLKRLSSSSSSIIYYI